MKSLKDFINEQLVLELSSDLLRRAENRAKEKASTATNKYEKIHRRNQASKFAKGKKEAEYRELEEQDLFKLSDKLYNKFSGVIKRIKSLGGQIADVKDNNNRSSVWGEWIEDWEDTLRISFNVSSFKDKKIEGFLEITGKYYNLYVCSLKKNDEYDNIFVTIDGKGDGDGAQMDESDARIVNDFINKVLDVDNDYMDYLMGN